MDVTSLLNTSTPEEEEKEEDNAVAATTDSPRRNRTPWDAGGYALPFNTLSKLPLATVQSIHRQESILPDSGESPTWPRHKFSDSRSSLSSLTSSTSTSYSTSHSRFSSSSTVYSLHSLQPSTSNCSESYKISPTTDPSNSARSGEYSPFEHRSATGVSPTASLSTLATVAEHQTLDRQVVDSLTLPKLTKQKTSHFTTPDVEMQSSNNPDMSRSASPSDAILFKRADTSSSAQGSVDTLMDTAEISERTDSRLSRMPSHSRGSESRGSSTTNQSRAHKRASSAPSFHGLDRARAPLPRPQRFGPTAELTPPPSHQPGDFALENKGPPPFRGTDTPPESVVDYENRPIVCMYIENCDTGSQLRKAISHIFGRNKMCTRLIPQGVWVHYCRKHYQRSRYRNPKEYAKLQCDLVQKQIDLLSDWSEGNSTSGKGPVVRDWGLNMRKREQKRLEDAGASKKAGAARAAEQGENDNDEDEDDAAAADTNDTNDATPATAVPRWLRDLCGRGYSTPEIVEIFNRLHRELLAEIIPVFPDIEILPNIVVDKDKDKDKEKQPAGSSPPHRGGYYARRKPAGAASLHRRTQSLTTPGPNGSNDMRLGASAVHGWTPVATAAATQKRKRFGGGPEDVWGPDEEEEDDDDRADRARFQRMRISEKQQLQQQQQHPTDSGMPRRHHPQHLAHRPAFERVVEHQAAEQEDFRALDGFASQRRGGEHRMVAAAAGQRPGALAAPTPQRRSAQSTAAQLEYSQGQQMQLQHQQQQQIQQQHQQQQRRRGGGGSGMQHHRRSQSDMTASASTFRGTPHASVYRPQPPPSAPGSSHQSFAHPFSSSSAAFAFTTSPAPPRPAAAGSPPHHYQNSHHPFHPQYQHQQAQSQQSQQQPQQQQQQQQLQQLQGFYVSAAAAHLQPQAQPSSSAAVAGHYPMRRPMRHMRHQSTPLATRSSPSFAAPMPPQQPGGGSSQQVAAGGGGGGDGGGTSPSQQGPSAHLRESPYTQSLYRARR